MTDFKGVTFAYSLYRPRGHYSRTEKLQRYFRGMMWLQTASFGLDHKDDVLAAVMQACALKLDKKSQENYRTLDELIMLPIYPAREKPIAGVTSAMVLRKVAGMSKYLCTPDQALELVPALCPDIVVTMGAGDIDRLVPRLEETLRAL